MNYFEKKNIFNDMLTTNKQECIPVGCLPTVAVSRVGEGWCLPGGGCLPRGVSARHNPCEQNDRQV